MIRFVRGDVPGVGGAVGASLRLSSASCGSARRSWSMREMWCSALMASAVGIRRRESRMEDGGDMVGGDVDGCVLARAVCNGILPVYKLDGRHQKVPIRPNAMSEDGREAQTVMALVMLVVSKRHF